MYTSYLHVVSVTDARLKPFFVCAEGMEELGFKLSRE